MGEAAGAQQVEGVATAPAAAPDAPSAVPPEVDGSTDMDIEAATATAQTAAQEPVSKEPAGLSRPAPEAGDAVAAGAKRARPAASLRETSGQRQGQHQTHAVAEDTPQNKQQQQKQQQQDHAPNGQQLQPAPDSGASQDVDASLEEGELLLLKEGGCHTSKRQRSTALYQQPQSSEQVSEQQSYTRSRQRHVSQQIGATSGKSAKRRQTGSPARTDQPEPTTQVQARTSKLNWYMQELLDLAVVSVFIKMQQQQQQSLANKPNGKQSATTQLPALAPPSMLLSELFEELLARTSLPTYVHSPMDLLTVLKDSPLLGFTSSDSQQHNALGSSRDSQDDLGSMVLLGLSPAGPTAHESARRGDAAPDVTVCLKAGQCVLHLQKHMFLYDIEEAARAELVRIIKVRGCRHCPCSIAQVAHKR
jgi:hypothetical protein